MTDEAEAAGSEPTRAERRAEEADAAARPATTPGPRHARRGRRPILPWVAFGLVAILAIGGGYGVYNYGRFVNGVTKIDALPAATVSGSAVPDIDGTAQNILLVGDDHRPEGATDAEMAELGTDDSGGGQNTDTMIVLHIAADGSAATLVSFPRDSYVEIPGFGMNKLNAAFSLGAQNGGGDSGGAKLLVQTVQQLSGVTIDHFVRISLLGFYQLVKALGPVSVCLNNAVQDHYSRIDLPAGVSKLSPSQALSFVRQRHGLPGGDLDRQVRQQYFLSVEARQILSAGTLLNPAKLGRVIDAVSGSMQTDSRLNFLSLAQSLRKLNPDAIRSSTIPITGTPTITVGGAPLSIVSVDPAAIPVFMKRIIDATDGTAISATQKPGATTKPGTSTEPSATQPAAPAESSTTAPVETTPTPTATKPGTSYARGSCIN